MVFRQYDRKVFAALESTGGTAATITTSTDFLETIEPGYAITPLQFERTPKVSTFTPSVMTTAGTAKSAPASQVEFTFGIELAGPGAAVSAGTAPQMARLLKACGLSETLDVAEYPCTSTSFAGNPLYNNEAIDGVADTYAAPEAYVWTDHFYGDSSILVPDATAGTLSAGTVKTQHSGGAVTVTDVDQSQVGVGYRPHSAGSDDDTASTSLTMRMYIDGAGTYVEGIGMRGTFEIAFVHGDRVVINFTFTGVLNSYTESGSDPTDYSYTAQVPPAWINTGLEMQTSTLRTANFDGALFNALTFTLGNEVTVRENTNAAKGYSSAIITGRTPTLTFNPDAVLSSGNYDFWDAFLGGDPVRMRWTVGSTAGNRIDFRVSAAQFTGISDGDRDTVSILDTTTTMTGGSYGSSVMAMSSSSVQTNSERGFDNEFGILFR